MTMVSEVIKLAQAIGADIKYLYLNKISKDSEASLSNLSNGTNSYKRKWLKYTRTLSTGLNQIIIPYGNSELVSFNVKALVVVDGNTETIYANGLWEEWKLCVYDNRATKSLEITKEAHVTNLDNASLIIYLEIDVL